MEALQPAVTVQLLPTICVVSVVESVMIVLPSSVTLQVLAVMVTDVLACRAIKSEATVTVPVW